MTIQMRYINNGRGFTNGRVYTFDFNPLEASISVTNYNPAKCISGDDDGYRGLWGNDGRDKMEDFWEVVEGTSTVKVIAGFDEQSQRNIVARLLSGETQQKVADSLSTSRGTIKRINEQMRPVLLREYNTQESSESENVAKEEPASSFTLVPKSIINIQHKGDVYTADYTHPQFNNIVDSAVSAEFDRAVELIDIAKAITEYSSGDVTIKGEVIYYKGQEVKDGLAKRIISMMSEGDEGFKRYVAFMSRLRDNPSYRAVKELFGFIGHSDIEITEDGYLVCWKRIRSDYTDCRTGKVPNYVGNTIRMERNMVDEDSDITCSQGLHVAAWNYLGHFYGDVIIKVKVDPSHVVSIPTDYNDSKMRTEQYEIMDVVNCDKKVITPEYIGNEIITVGEKGAILNRKPITLPDN